MITMAFATRSGDAQAPGGLRTELNEQKLASSIFGLTLDEMHVERGKKCLTLRKIPAAPLVIVFIDRLDCAHQ